MAIVHSTEKKRRLEEETERREILDAMRRTREELEQARSSFNNVKDPELVESCVFEMNALQARYAYYLRLVKELHFEADQISFRLPRVWES